MAHLIRPELDAAQQPAVNKQIERLRWVIGLRWAVVAALLLVGLLGSSSPVHIGLALLVLLYNLFYFYASRRPDFGTSLLTDIVRFGQVPVDLVVLTVLVHFSGGVTGPVFVLYFLYIFVGLAILPLSGAYWVAIIATLCYGALAFIEAFWAAPPLARAVAGSRAEAVIPNSTYLGYVLTVGATLMINAYIANYFAGLLTRDERTIRQQLGEMNTLYNFTRLISTTFSSDDVTKMLLSLVRETARPSSAALIFFGENGEGRVGTSFDLSAEEKRVLEDAPIAPTLPLMVQLRSNRKGLAVPSLEADPPLKAAIPRTGARSFYAVPMMHNDRLIAALYMCFDRSHTLPASQWDLLGTVTQQAALAIERGRLFADAERGAREMAGLYHIGLATTSSLQIDEVLRMIYEQVNRVFHPDTFYIAMYDEEAGELCFDIFVEAGEFLPPFRTRLESGVSAWVIRNRRPIFVRNWDVEIEQLPFEAGFVGAPTQSIINVPLTAKNKMVGVMSVQSLKPDAFDEEHLRLLTSVAGQAALALENAKLHAQVNDQAQRDPLTGVFNHGVFIEKLNAAVKQAADTRSAVALVMLDIDRFKQYNDTYGHMVGDDVLRSIVVSVQNHLKSTDVVGRWGGEEFGIILQGVSRAQARVITERIRQTAARAALIDIHNRTIPSPTVSQGIAMYPDDATGIEELIDKADSALYRAKDLGRNQIAEWIDLEGQRGPVTFRARG